jgi:hypothetical protein
MPTRARKPIPNSTDRTTQRELHAQRQPRHQPHHADTEPGEPIARSCEVRCHVAHCEVGPRAIAMWVEAEGRYAGHAVNTSLWARSRHPWRETVRRTDPPPLTHFNDTSSFVKKGATSGVCVMNPNMCYRRDVPVRGGNANVRRRWLGVAEDPEAPATVFKR